MMNGSTVAVGWGLGAALLTLTVVAGVVAGVARLGVSRDLATASVRGVVQLAAVSAVVIAVVQHIGLAVAFVVVMFGVAAFTSARRITGHRSGFAACLPIAVGAFPVVMICVAFGAVPLTGIALVPVSGIVIGGTMAATSLAGRRALDELHARHGEYEAALSLGLLERDAALELTRGSARQALIPALDQTRTVGLVTLPGAFVGVLIGSGDPVQAGAAQVLVLVGLLAAESIAVALTVELVARGRIRRP
jgi:putative ABC transport system permease protein